MTWIDPNPPPAAIDPKADAKRAAAQAAVAEVMDGMLLGLGTGSTAAFAIAALGARVSAGLRVTAAVTSHATERAAIAAGIELIDFGGIGRVDLCIDGADEVDARFLAIKGAGGALLREKIVARGADRMICIVDEAKLVERLGARPLPIEVLPFARAGVVRSIERLGGVPTLRLGPDGAARLSDQANLLIDCEFGTIPDPHALAVDLQAIPGLLGHGLFLTEIDAVFAGDTVRRERMSSLR